MFSRGRNSDDSARRRRAFADGSATATATAPHTSTRAMPTERRAHTPLADASNALDRARERTALSASKKSAREMARGERTSGALDATTLATTRASLERGLSSVEAVIEDIERQVEAECAKIIEHGEVECEKLASEHASRWRTIPKTVKLAPLTEFADDLARDGSEEALIELAEVNKVLGAIDESLVRRIVDE